MAIKGLTDLATLEGKGFPLIARLYKGAPKTEENRPGKDLEWFRVEFETGYEHLAPIWKELYGDRPDTFNNVQLTRDTTEEVFATWLEEWNGSGTLLKRCDGEFIQTRWDAGAGMYSTAKIACANKDGHECGCKRVGRLAIMLPELLEASGVVGEILVTTHSVNDIIHVSRYLYNLEKAIGGGVLRGGLMGIPFTFGRGAHEISAPKSQKQADGSYKATGTRMIVNKSLFYLYAEPEFVKQVILPRVAETAQLRATVVAQLPAVATIATSRAAQVLGGGDKPRIMRDVNLDKVEIKPVVDESTGEIIENEAPEITVTADETVIEAPAPVAVITSQNVVSWDDDKWISKLLEMCRKVTKVDDLQLTQIGAMIGMEKPGVHGVWQTQFPAGMQDAVAAVKAAFDQQFDELAS